MDNGIYIAASKQMAKFREMNIVASNIANMNTTGYQSEHMIFERFLVDDHVRGNMNFTNDVASFRNTQQGGFQVTNNTLDLAIRGEGYFVVDTPNGERYTRAGNFQLDENGQLITPEGYAVLDDGAQPIIFDLEATDITVGGSGVIQVNGEEFGRIGLVKFENEQLLERQGARMFSSEATPIEVTDSEILQGTLETSNVQSVKELTHMIKVSRSTTSTAKFIEVMYDLQRRNTQVWTRQA